MSVPATGSPNDWLRISYSSLNLFSSCPRKFEFNKLYPRRARDYDTFAADVGKCLHAGYQQYLVNRSEHDAFWAMAMSYPYEAEWNQDNDFRSFETCTVLLEEMIQSAQMLEFRVAQIKRPLTDEEKVQLAFRVGQGLPCEYDSSGITVPAIEVPFELRLDGIVLPDGRGVAVTGFVDAFLINTMTERFRTMDIKTHRSFQRYGSDRTAKYKYDEQQVPYGIVLEHIQDKPVDEFEVLYLDCLVDLAEPKVELYTFEKDRQSIQEWLVDTVLRVQNIQTFMEMDYFPRRGTNCLSWNKPCFFLDICALRDKKQIEAWLLEGQAADHRVEANPWVIAHLDVYGQKEAA